MPKHKLQELLKHQDIDEIESIKVENALLKLALGYKYKVKIIQQNKTFVTEKYVPPDTQACIFWLRNRKPMKWGNVKNTAFRCLTEQDITITISDKTT